LIRISNVYPNPLHEKLNISIDDYLNHNIQIEIIDMSGKTVKTLNSLKAQYNQVDMSDIANGTYLLIIKDGDHKYVKTIIKI
jgi:hypothetical protein